MPSLYQFQEESVEQLLAGKRIVVAGMGTGKSAMAMCYAEQMYNKTGKRKVLVVTTASKSRVKNSEGLDDFSADAKKFCSPSFVASLSSSLTLISWHKLKAWVEQHWGDLCDYVVIFDEVARSKGYTTGMGKAFLKITKRNPDWAGFTGTPGDSWEAYISYFVATGLVRNKTSYLRDYANVQTYKGYPEIVGWRNEDKLRNMWAKISYAPDTSIVAQQMPKEQYRTITFSKPRAYSTVLKTRMRASSDPANPTDDDFLDTAGAMVAELRRLCFTKDKQQWVADFVEGLESGCIFFYNYIVTGDLLEEIIKKALGKDGRVWRIDGKHHEIPTAETIGPKDMVVCQWQSGSEALNLQMLHYWVAVELCYSNSMLQQAMGRIRRIGQEHSMLFQRLVTSGTIEQDIIKCLAEKKEFSEKTWCISNNLIENEEDG